MSASSRAAGLLLASLVIGAPAIVRAADAKPPADPAQPATTVRVGGSRADAQFRDANQKALARYRQAAAGCRARPAGERRECVRSAKADLKTAQRVAKTAHDSASRRR
jgi:hypothetical protein